MKENNEKIQALDALVKTNTETGGKTIDGRKFHKFLENGTRFNDWIQRRVEEYGFFENEDFTHYSKMSNVENQRVRNPIPLKEYDLTLDMAKELAMVEKTERGRMARKYFIAVEKMARELLLPVLNGVKPLTDGVQAGYPRKEAFISSGYVGDSGSIKSLKKKLPNDFYFISRVACISKRVFLYIMQNGKTRQLRLGLFSDNRQLEGGAK